MNVYYKALAHITFFALFILITMIVKSKTFERRAKQEFICCYVMVIVAYLAEYFGLWLEGTDPSLRIMHIVFKFLELSIAPMIPVVAASAVLPEKKKFLPRLIVSIHTVIELVSLKFGFIFYVDGKNYYSHGPFYWIYILAYTLSCLYFLYRVFISSIHYQSRNKISLLLIMLFILIGSNLSLLNSEIRISWAAVAFGNMLLLVYYSDLIQQVDVLTELLDRRSFENNTKIIKGKAYIICIDADDFKSVNDRYGHKSGDVCLKELGRILRETYGRYGLCYRTGGDEFCVIADRHIDDIEAVNREFRENIANAVKENPILTTVSMGQALYNPLGLDFEHALHSADTAMYKEKREKKIKRGESVEKVDKENKVTANA